MLCTAKEEEMSSELQRHSLRTSIPVVQSGRKAMDSTLAVKRSIGIIHAFSCSGTILTFVLMLIVSQRMIENHS